VIELTPNDIAHGGEAVARYQGKAHFIAGAIPGERISGDITLDKGSWARVELRAVLDSSPDRVAPPCPHFERCGGCQWQYADYPAQLRWKESILRGQLEHIGRLRDPNVGETVPAAEPYAYRNRMDFRVFDGQPALHQRRSKQLVPLDVCLLLQPSLSDLFERLGDLTGVERITIRSSATTDERLVVVGGEVPPQATEWGADVVRRQGRHTETLIGSGAIHEVVEEEDLRITADAFFQNNTAGAMTLVDLVGQALELRPDETLLDAYAGGGLFAATVGQSASRVIAVESSAIAVADLRRNLKKSPLTDFRVVKGDVTREIPSLDEYWNAAIADPPRTGLGQDGVDAVTAATPRVVVYVSCDPASLARDARLLREAGYVLDTAVPVDLFPQTYHVEAVARFLLVGGEM
jgi:23S rRNA (uracil1939-C5)-methyltransferase